MTTAPADNRVAVIGGGISGLTTAILLQVNDYRTFLYARQRPSHEPDIVRDPAFASLHAAASILPHSVASPNVGYWTAISQEFFRALSFRATCGVRTQVHYEMCEEPAIEPPSYAGAVDDFELLRGLQVEASGVPRRRGAEALSGWRFNAFFCEVPEYMRHLYDLYETIGGRVMPGGAVEDYSLVGFLRDDYQYIVNCTGSGAHQFLADAVASPEFYSRFADAEPSTSASTAYFEPLADKAPAKLIRGHYLRADIKELLPDASGRFFSYNYKPSPDVYKTSAGHAADVYCYPRSDAWILGGSRQEGRVGEDGSWEGDTTVGPELVLNRDEDGESLAIPAPILQLNAELLAELTGGRLDLVALYKQDSSILSPGVGYRFVRDSQSDSVRVGVTKLVDSSPPSSELAERYVLHNYGHGGSGFTLSWGCALQVLQLLDDMRQQGERRPVSLNRRKFVLGHAATRMMLVDLTARLLERLATR